MSRPLASLEHFFERIFERPAARLFQTSVEPVQVQRRLERAMDAGRESKSGYVPDRFSVYIHPTDLEFLGDLQTTLEGEFAEGLLARSRQRGYRLAQRPLVSFVADPTVGRGEVAIEAGYGPAEAPRAEPPPAAEPSPLPAAAVEVAAAEPIEPLQGLDGEPPVSLVPEPPAEQPSRQPIEQPVEQVGERPIEPLVEPSAYAIAMAPPATSTGTSPEEPPAPHAYLEIVAPGKPSERMPVGPAMIRIGRGSDNDLVAADSRVSRQHGTIALRHGLLVYTDLDSTNGSFVNGTRVAQIALGPGDVVRVGDTTITIVPAT